MRALTNVEFLFVNFLWKENFETMDRIYNGNSMDIGENEMARAPRNSPRSSPRTYASVILP